LIGSDAVERRTQTDESNIRQFAKPSRHSKPELSRMSRPWSSMTGKYARMQFCLDPAQTTHWFTFSMLCFIVGAVV